jgi:hypothetical protein
MILTVAAAARDGSSVRRARQLQAGASSASPRVEDSGINASSLDEIREVVGANPHVPADSTEADPSLGDEPSHEASRRSQLFSYLVNC